MRDPRYSIFCGVTVWNGFPNLVGYFRLLRALVIQLLSYSQTARLTCPSAPATDPMLPNGSVAFPVAYGAFVGFSSGSATPTPCGAIFGFTSDEFKF